MVLTSPRFKDIIQLQRIADGTSNFTTGAKGDGVRAIQDALILWGYALPVSTLKGKKPPDGVYGAETLAAVKDLQTRFGMQPRDGNFRAAEMALFDRTFPPATPAPSSAGAHHCGNCFAEFCTSPDLSKLQSNGAANGKHPLIHKVGAGIKHFGADLKARAGAFKQKIEKKVKPIIAGIKAIDIPNVITPLEEFIDRDPAWFNAVDKTFGASLDYRNIFVNNGLGYDGRQFVMFIPIPHFLRPKMPTQAKGVLLMQMGPFNALTTDILCHELTHCWQSQHASHQGRFMGNAVASQRAGAKNGGSAYAYQFSPLKKFEEYGAEQLAQQVQNGVQATIDHLRSFQQWAIDPALEIALSSPKWDSTSRAGVTE